MVQLEEHEFTFGDNKKTFYLTAGPSIGPLLVFVHGWPAIASTWKPQLETFASLGFRVVAPDMPGYGRSTATKNAEDYSQENINNGMLALLEHLGRDQAVWIGHDWGCGSVWTFGEHYPEKCIGLINMAVPSHVLELGLEALLKHVNRDIYPEDKCPYGQWSYQAFYERSFEKATKFFDADPAAVLRLMYSKGDSTALSTPAFTSTVNESDGWFGGVEKPDPNWKHMPAEKMCIDEETYSELVSAMKHTSFWGADSWYSNHKRNRAYAENWKNDGYLHMPVLFIEAKFDNICATSTTTLSEPMRKYCTDLTETSIDSGHWVAQEKPVEVNAAIARWLAENLKTYWPGYWSNPHVKGKI